MRKYQVVGVLSAHIITCFTNHLNLPCHDSSSIPITLSVHVYNNHIVHDVVYTTTTSLLGPPPLLRYLTHFVSAVFVRLLFEAGCFSIYTTTSLAHHRRSKVIKELQDKMLFPSSPLVTAALTAVLVTFSGSATAQTYTSCNPLTASTLSLGYCTRQSPSPFCKPTNWKLSLRS